jgi:hypothetical protein
MNLPEQPSTFRPEPTTPRPWRWECTDKAGNVVEVTGALGGQTFASQADAESWVGEVWADLAEQGVDNVTLYEADRQVYGPMSLHA